MDGRQIQKILDLFIKEKKKKEKKIHYTHVESILADQLPKKKIKNNRGVIFIVNTLTSYDPIDAFGHYVVLSIYNNTLLYFDPFNLRARFYKPYINNFLVVNSVNRQILTLGRRVQHEKTTVCGGHCLLMSFFLIKHTIPSKAMMEADKYYSRNNLNNDRKVVKFLYGLDPSLPKCQYLFCDRVQSLKQCKKKICED